MTMRLEDILEKLSGKVESAEVYELRAQVTPVRFRGGALESAKSEERAGWALRVIREGRLGYATTTDLENPDLLIENALATAEFGEPAPLQFPGRREGPTVEEFDPQVESLQLEELIAAGEEAIDKVKRYDERLQIEASLGKAIEEIRLANTSGQQVFERRTSVWCSLEVQRAEEGDIFNTYDETSSRSLQQIDHLKLAENIIEQLRWAERLAAVKTKQLPALFTPHGALVLLFPLIVGFDGKSVYLGTSPLQGRLGEPVFAEQLTLLDDGTVPFAARSGRYDDEGVPTSRKSLIERGVVRNFLYDLKTAALAQAEPTGNGFKMGLYSGRDFKHPPSISPTSLLIAPGEQSWDELLRGMKEGLIVDQVLGLGQGNIASGEFSNNVSVGFYVRDGEIVGRVKNTMIAGNVYDLLKDKLLAIGSEAEWAYGLVHTPPLLIDSLNVVGR